MAHAIWSGSINFGLVTIPVKVFTAVKSDDLSFNMLHAKDEGRIKYERVCSVDGKPGSTGGNWAAIGTGARLKSAGAMPTKIAIACSSCARCRIM